MKPQQARAMEQEKVREALFLMLKGFTHNFHNIDSIKDAPLDVQLAVDKLESSIMRDGSVHTEAISDLRLTFKDIDSLPADVLVLIRHHCTIPW